MFVNLDDGAAQEVQGDVEAGAFRLVLQVDYAFQAGQFAGFYPYSVAYVVTGYSSWPSI